jgi:hypothetical protein
MNGAELLTQTITVDWAFSSGSSANGTMKRKNTRFAYGYMEKVEGHWKERKEMLSVFSFWYPNFTHSSRKKLAWA